jgi:nucleotide sugar dehydrogenase
VTASLTITVVGLGKIGLPLAVQYAGLGHRVIGADINPAVVADVNAGVEPFPGEFDLARRLGELVDAGTLTATTSTADAVRQSDAVVVVVPVAIDAAGTPDFQHMDGAVADIGSSVGAGTVVSFETTVPMGTTRDRFAPAIEAASGLREGVELFVVYSPERVLTGRVFADLRRYPKLVGALNAAGAARAVGFYESVLEFDDRPDLPRANGVWDLGSAEAAELAKLAETTYRDVNIALANTFAVYAESAGIDIGMVIDACNSQPYSHIHRPGVAVGGHCIPVYPHLYLSNDPAAVLVRTAREVNSAMPAHVVDRLSDALSGLQGQTVVILGAAYRGGVKETAFSGVFPLVEAVVARGGLPVVHDPMYSDGELEALGLVPFHSGDRADGAILQADHAEYREWGPAEIERVRCIVDGRGVTSAALWPGVQHLVIGRAS